MNSTCAPSLHFNGILLPSKHEDEDGNRRKKGGKAKRWEKIEGMRQLGLSSIPFPHFSPSFPPPTWEVEQNRRGRGSWLCVFLRGGVNGKNVIFVKF